jgi:MOSC domain-containing protein YiiM
MSSVTGIVYKPEGTTPDQGDHYLRIPLESATLVTGYGIEGDRKGGNPKRNLNIMSFETLEALHQEGFNTQLGQMGEQIDIKGFDVSKLAVGDKLQIGEAAIVEVISYRTGCERFEHIQGKTAQQAAGRMGIMAKVITGGRITVGDSVKLL